MKGCEKYDDALRRLLKTLGCNHLDRTTEFVLLAGLWGSSHLENIPTGYIAVLCCILVKYRFFCIWLMLQTDSRLQHIKITQIGSVVLSLQELFSVYLDQLTTFTILTVTSSLTLLLFFLLQKQVETLLPSVKGQADRNRAPDGEAPQLGLSSASKDLEAVSSNRGACCVVL